MEKVLRVADLRNLEKQVHKAEISYSRMVELINEKAFMTYCNIIHDKVEEIKHLKVLVENKNAFIETLEKKVKLTTKGKTKKDENVIEQFWYKGAHYMYRTDGKCYKKPLSSTSYLPIRKSDYKQFKEVANKRTGA